MIEVALEHWLVQDDHVSRHHSCISVKHRLGLEKLTVTHCLDSFLHVLPDVDAEIIYLL
jgi:hypothetical protein